MYMIIQQGVWNEMCVRTLASFKARERVIRRELRSRVVRLSCGPKHLARIVHVGPEDVGAGT